MQQAYCQYVVVTHVLCIITENAYVTVEYDNSVAESLSLFRHVSRDGELAAGRCNE